ncbi:cbb3-type cytochrome c oxidase N-terminal domain-containing protein [Mucilaginibacter polytrichastri]|nr:cbb3-type cytochrome c oxidase N-terminal domain-containing protein [Mucilaginibacter polytrichastri]SFS91697.1 cytochrome c oxidase cbb3-type subunit 3 [Mucilaginibacter polytrichastri]
MKLIKPILLIVLVMAAQGIKADSLISGQDKNYIAYGAIMMMLILLVIVMLVLLRTFKVLTKIIIGPEAYATMKAEEAAAKIKLKPKTSVVERLLELKPLDEEAALIIPHDYDGIQEIDNPIPSWFTGLFYATIVFAIGYLLVYHVFGIGQLQYAEYNTEMAVAAKEKEVFLSKSANRVDENSVKLSVEPGVIADGQSIFKLNCVPCHGDHAQGVVGPNLTDDYWLHGSKISDVFKTVKYGVAAKGMPTWEKQLSPKQIADVANYIKSLHGSNPANPKEAQGEKEVEDVVKAAPKTANAAAAK